MAQLDGNGTILCIGYSERKATDREVCYIYIMFNHTRAQTHTHTHTRIRIHSQLISHRSAI